MPAENIAGKTFGSLTALYPTPLRANTSVVWHCLCTCGNDVDIPRNQLVGGRRTSCGCKKYAPRPDLTGKQFGRLTVLNMLPERRGGYTVWHCKCQCGRETDVTSRDLKSGMTRSCGCLVADRAREGQRRIDGTSITRLENSSTIFRNNTSGIRGVSFRTQDMRWVAYISFKGKKKTLGAFKTIEEAKEARRRAEQVLYERFLEEYYQSQIQADPPTTATLPAPGTPADPVQLPTPTTAQAITPTTAQTDGVKTPQAVGVANTA